jgi:23S rRNA pseudouridine955/2504/2580 synthase
MGVRFGATIFRVAEGDGGQRLDKLLRRRFPSVPLSHVFQTLRKGDVRVNGAKAKGEARVQDGDEISVRLPTQESCDPALGESPSALSFRGRIPVLWEDDELLVLDKPAGLAVHPGTGVGPGRTVIEMVQAAFPGTGFPPALAHRLDKGTSGVLVLAKTRRMLVCIQDEIRAHRTGKTYMALAEGRPRAKAGTVDSRLARIDSARGGAKAIPAQEESGREAHTRWKVVRQLPRHAFLEVAIDTGRMHQIRAHLASIGLPLVGDGRYHPDPSHDTLGLKRPFLHAARFEVRLGGRLWAFDAPLPKDLSQALMRAEALC